MSITISDPQLLAVLTEKRGVVELRDPDGEIVGRVQTTWPTAVPLTSRESFAERVADVTLNAEFARVKRDALLFDPCGELVGLFEREWFEMPLPPRRLRELEERRREARNQKGYTLAEVWKIIHEKYVGDDVEPLIVDVRETTGRNGKVVSG